MYGIRRGELILCNGREFIFELLPPALVYDPVMRHSAYVIDSLMQDLSVEWGDYNLTVFEFTKKQEAEMIIRRLKGKR